MTRQKQVAQSVQVCPFGKPLSTQIYLYCSMLRIDVLRGIGNVTAEHMDQSYRPHMTQYRAWGFRAGDLEGDYRSTKRVTPERMSPSIQWVHQMNKAHQRRVIRVSEMFAEHRSSGDARPERSERSVFPWKGMSALLTGVEISKCDDVAFALALFA